LLGSSYGFFPWKSKDHKRYEGVKRKDKMGGCEREREREREEIVCCCVCERKRELSVCVCVCVCVCV
jgi:hypothetical protein